MYGRQNASQPPGSSDPDLSSTSNEELDAGSRSTPRVSFSLSSPALVASSSSATEWSSSTSSTSSSTFASSSSFASSSLLAPSLATSSAVPRGDADIDAVADADADADADVDVGSGVRNSFERAQRDSSEHDLLSVAELSDFPVHACAFAVQGNSDSVHTQTFGAQGRDLADGEYACPSVVRRALLTRRVVVLNNVLDSTELTDCEYVRTKRPLSMLCMPASVAGHLTVLVYLENRQLTGAFAPDRLRFLEVISNQIALSVRNAQYFTDLSENYAELAQKNKELATLDTMKDEFLASTSHELRTPLAGIIGICGELIHQSDTSLQQSRPPLSASPFATSGSGSASPASSGSRTGGSGALVVSSSSASSSTTSSGSLVADFREDLEHIVSCARRLARLVNDILDYSSLKHRHIQLRPQSFSLLAVVQSVVKLLNPLSREKDLDVRIEVASTLPLVIADRSRIEQVITNLMSNSIKFTERGGSIRIECKPAEEWLREPQSGFGGLVLPEDIRQSNALSDLLVVAVTDSGCGMTSTQLKNVFVPFTSTLSAPVREESQMGTGLGLAITRRLVELHGCQIWASSAGPGQGSQLAFTLPIFRQRRSGEQAIDPARDASLLLAQAAQGSADCSAVDERSTRAAGSLFSPLASKHSRGASLATSPSLLSSLPAEATKEPPSSSSSSPSPSSSASQSATTARTQTPDSRRSLGKHVLSERNENQQCSSDATALEDEDLARKRVRLDAAPPQGAQLTERTTKLASASITESGWASSSRAGSSSSSSSSVSSSASSASASSISSSSSCSMSSSSSSSSTSTATSHPAMERASTRKRKRRTPADAENRTLARRGEGFRVLCVDDNDVNLLVLRRMLEHDGYEVLFSRSGQQALDCVEREESDPVHVILCDLMMPQMNGLDVVRHLRVRWSPFQLPVLMVTAKHRTSGDLKAGFEAGVNDYLSKPFDREDILCRVNMNCRLAKETRTLLQRAAL